MGNFIVYKHTSPSGKCYVGITSQAPECRWGNDGCKYLEIHNNIRPVNINTIKWLIIGGTKYVVE